MNWPGEVCCSLVSNSRRTSRYVHLTRWVLIVLISVPVFALLVQDVVSRWHDRGIVADDIERLFRMQDQGEQLPTEYAHLWERVEPTCISFERICLDLETRLQKGRRYFDRIYVEGMIVELQESIAREPRLSLFLLGHYAMKEDHPFIQALSLIAIREQYPKKYSIYYANRFINSDHPTLSHVCSQIVAGRYQVSSLTDKYTRRYLKSSLKQ